MDSSRRSQGGTTVTILAVLATLSIVVCMASIDEEKTNYAAAVAATTTADTRLRVDDEFLLKNDDSSGIRQNIVDYGEFDLNDAANGCRILRDTLDSKAPIVLYGSKCRCCDGGDRSPPTELPPTETPSPPPTKPTPKPSACPSNTNGRTIKIRHETDCNAYYRCTDGRKELKRCGQGEMFNARLQVCDLPVNVDCDTEEAAFWRDRRGGTIPLIM